MVFPLFDDNSDRRRFPWVNYAFIIANVLVFITLQEAGDFRNRFTYAWSTVPSEIVLPYVALPTASSTTWRWFGGSLASNSP